MPRDPDERFTELARGENRLADAVGRITKSLDTLRQTGSAIAGHFSRLLEIRPALERFVGTIPPWSGALKNELLSRTAGLQESTAPAAAIPAARPLGLWQLQGHFRNIISGGEAELIRIAQQQLQVQKQIMETIEDQPPAQIGWRQ